MTPPPHPPRPPASRLPRLLAPAYLALVVYASLYPFAGWRDLGLSPLAFLDAGWPRWWTGFDLAVNIGVYVPLGFLLTLVLAAARGPARPPLAAALLAAGLAALLSLGLETVQNWLPARVPSNLDLACNSLGGLLGALAAAWRGPRALAALGRLERRLIAPLPQADTGLALLGLWLLTQLSPETLLFGAGDLRQLLGLAPGMPFAAPRFFLVETAITACNTLAIGLFARTLLADRLGNRLTPPLALAAFLVLALGVRTVAAGVLVGPGSAFAWLTPGAGIGLAAGASLLALALLLPAAWRVALAGAALMGGTALVNIAPVNPYSAAALATWQQGHFLNFNGATRLVAALWPFLALPWLTLLGRRI